MMKKPVNKRKIIFSIIIAIFVVAISALMFYKTQLTAIPRSKTIIFEVKASETGHQVIHRLHEDKLIKNEMVAKLYMKFNQLEHIKAGKFKIEKDWGTDQILETLNDVSKGNAGDISVTITEGMWAKDIALILEKQLGIKAKDLIALWNNDKYLKTLIKKYDFLSDDILNSAYKVKLEGYLFPETYSFPDHASLEHITEIFLDQFANKIKPLESEIKKSKFSIHELITFASVVQYESSNIDDMKMIAGVFNNRLDRHMTLDSSVTVCYALYDKLESHVDCEVKTNIDSPYNTYRVQGLPVGPILNPGIEAIEAVLSPTKSDYLYFVADIYGDGKVYYSKTLKEHEKKIDQFKLRY